jgi:hypothetical protein
VEKSLISKLPSRSDVIAWMKRNRWEIGVTLAAFVLAVLAFNWKGFNFAKVGSVLIGDQGDTLTFTSLVYQAIDNLFHRPTNLGYALIFYPDPAPFAYTVAPYGIAIFVLPLYLLTGLNLELTMNIYILLTFALTALAVYLLVRYLLDVSVEIAALVGLMVAFAQFRFIHVAHIETLSTQFYLLALYCLHRFIDTPVRKWAIWLAVAFWFTFFTSGYMGYMFFVTVGVLLLFLFFWGKLPLDREALRSAAIFVLTTTVISLPFLAMRAQKHGAIAGYSIETIEHYAASPIDWTSGSSFLYMSLTKFANEKALFLGFTPIALALAGWLLRRREGAGAPAAAERAATRRLSPREVVVVYGTLTVLSYLLTLGPRIDLTSTVEIPSPYMLFLQVPGFSSLRVPARIILIAIAGVAVLGAHALAVLSRRLDRMRYLGVFALVAVAATLELIPYNGTSSEERSPNSYVVLSPVKSTIPPMNVEMPKMPMAAYAWLKAQPPGTAVYNFPATPEANRQYMYGLRFHGQPMLNGQASFLPRWFTQVNVDTFPTRGLLKILHERKIKYALVHNRFLAADKRAEISKLVRGYLDAGWLRSVGRFDDVDVYEVETVKPLRAIHLEFDGPIEGKGWQKAEAREGGRSFAWTGAATATIDLLLQADRDLDVVFETNAGIVPTMPDSLTLAVNGQPIPLRKTKVDNNYRFMGVIPQSLLDPNEGLVTLEFHTAPPVSPASLGRGSRDKRELGLAFDWLDLKPHSSLVSLDFDRSVQGDGWYGPETDASGASVTWMSDTAATLTLPVTDPGDLALIARVEGLDKEALASLAMSVNETPIRLSRRSDGDAVVVRALVPAATVGEGRDEATITVRVDRLRTGKDPKGEKRQQGLAFDWLYLYAANSVRLEFDSFPVGDGWFGPETDALGVSFRWMAEKAATLVLPLPPDRASAVEFRVLRAPTPEILNSLSLTVNGEKIGLTYDNTTGDDLFRGVISPAAVGLADPASAVLTFHVGELESMKAVGEGADERRVGCAFDWLEFRPVSDGTQ